MRNSFLSCGMLGLCTGEQSLLHNWIPRTGVSYGSQSEQLRGYIYKYIWKKAIWKLWPTLSSTVGIRCPNIKLPFPNWTCAGGMGKNEIQFTQQYPSRRIILTEARIVGMKSCVFCCLFLFFLFTSQLKACDCHMQWSTYFTYVAVGLGKNCYIPFCQKFQVISFSIFFPQALSDFSEFDGMVPVV